MARAKYSSRIDEDAANFDPNGAKTATDTAADQKRENEANFSDSSPSIPATFYSRDTIYLTYEQHVALQVIAMRTSRDRSSIVREILDKALEEAFPGIFEQTKDIAEDKRRADFDKFVALEAKRAVKG